MNVFFVFVAILLATVFIAYFAWKLIKYTAYNLSCMVVKWIDTRNGVVINIIDGKPRQLNKVAIVLSNAENGIRSNWLQSSFSYPLGALAIFLGCYFFIAYYGNIEEANELLMVWLGSVIVLAISTVIMIFFAYVKFGTKWIGCFVYLSPIRTTLEWIEGLTETFNLPDLTIAGICYTLIVYLFSISLYVYFWIHCKRLYQLNSKIKKRKIEKESSELELIPVV